LGGPVCEAVNPTQKVADPVGLIPLGFEPDHEPIDKGQAELEW
jgi:hypothetical protein